MLRKQKQKSTIAIAYPKYIDWTHQCSLLYLEVSTMSIQMILSPTFFMCLVLYPLYQLRPLMFTVVSPVFSSVSQVPPLSTVVRPSLKTVSFEKERICSFCVCIHMGVKLCIQNKVHWSNNKV